LATNVIHGTGKPRIGIVTEVIHTNAITAVTDNPTSDVVELTNAITGGLAGLDATYGLVNALLWSYTSADVLTWAKILSFTDTAGHFLTVLSWENGIAANGKACFIQGYRLDLPYCQRLTEMWMPDTVAIKLYSGNIYRKKRGFYYAASLDYSGYAHKDTIQLFRQLLRIDKTEIYFYPRVDNVSIVYKVDLSPETEIVLNQIQQHAGHRSWIINLIGSNGSRPEYFRRLRRWLWLWIWNRIIKGEIMKKLILVLILLAIEVFPQVTSPSGYTTNYRFRKWTQGANPSADSINANWDGVDGYIKVAYDSAQNKVNLYTNQTIVSGLKSISGGGISLQGGRLFFGNNTATSPLYMGELCPTTSRTYLTYTSNLATDTLATLANIRSGAGGYATLAGSAFTGDVSMSADIRFPAESVTWDGSGVIH